MSKSGYFNDVKRIDSSSLFLFFRKFSPTLILTRVVVLQNIAWKEKRKKEKA